VVNSTITANGSEYGGGGLCNHTTANFTSTTIAGNIAGGQGAERRRHRQLQRHGSLRNTIVAKNTADSEGGGPDVLGAVTSLGYNLIGNNADATITPVQFTDQIGIPIAPIDPKLGPLQNNGGPTLTMFLSEGSPALDKGHSSGVLKDQRGVPRPADLPSYANATGGDGADIGAFEHGFAHLDVDANGAYHAPTDGLLIQRFCSACPDRTSPMARSAPRRSGRRRTTSRRSSSSTGRMDVDGNGRHRPADRRRDADPVPVRVAGSGADGGLVGASATRTPARSRPTSSR
jgi:hypothetical protein